MTLAVLSGSPTDTGDDRNSVKMRLPKLNLPTFDGNILYWQEFWNIFTTSVHEQDIPDVTKFSYLKSSLCPAAASGISVTNDNCKLAIGILKVKLGKREDNIEVLYSRLQHLPLAMNQFNDIKFTYKAMEKILRQLETQGENVDQHGGCSFNKYCRNSQLKRL